MKDYILGLDIGSNSVGWACIDKDYNLCKFHGKNMWGARLISDVDTAADRRVYRSARRRIERRKERINLLRGLIGPEIIKTDQHFFRRLEYSFLIPDDVSKKQFGKENVSILFDDVNYKDKDYFKKYPTIYHLRHAMINSNDKFDLREIYLVLHHMIKYRGNFLYEGGLDTFGRSLDIRSCINALFDYEFQNDELDGMRILEVDNEQKNQIIDILEDDSIPKYISNKRKSIDSNILTKEEVIANIFETSNKAYNKNDIKKIINIVRAILGYNFNLCEILEIDNIGENQNVFKFKFDDSFDEKRYNIYDLLSEDNIRALELLESCCTAYSFKNIMHNSNYICDAKITTYNKHKEDLSLLKKYIKGICREIDNFDLYNLMFRENLQYKNNDAMFKVGCPYSMYVKNQQNIKRKGQLYSGCSKELLYLFITNIINIQLNKDEKVVKTFKDNLDIDLSQVLAVKNTKINDFAIKILAEIESDKFMPKLNDVSNSLLPYQLNLKEMHIILEKQSKYYDVLKENKDKVEAILTFKRPYYVGVLNPNSLYSWAKDGDGNSLVTNEKVYPWNFNECIDKEGFQQQFIKRLSGKCEYFPDEEVLPKKSIRYQAYCVLNELNKIRISTNGTKKYHLISTDLKIHLFNSLFLQNKKVSVKKLIAELKKYNKNLYQNLSFEDIQGLSKLKEKGIDAEFNNSMSTYIALKKIFGLEFNIKHLDTYDEIVNILAVFKDKEVIKERLKNITDLSLSEKQINMLMSLNMEGWGRYSKKFLDEIVDNNNKTILEELYYGRNDQNKEKNVCYNLNELIFDKLLGFKEQVLNDNFNSNMRFSYEKDIKPLYCSPSVKSILWQTILIVEEITKICKKPPVKIFVEDTKEDQVKKQTNTRYEHLYQLYKSIKESNDYKELLDELKTNEENINFLDDKLYLYFTQMGKCMYSGEKLSLLKLNEYEIDHIIPRCLIKDDSFSNRVLVKKIENQRKKGSFVLDPLVVSKCKDFWQYLRDHQFISKQKYNALTRSEYTNSDIEGFINRQLVETNQIIKLFRDVYGQKYKNENIIGLRASITSQFRIDQMIKGNAGFAKIRGLNDMHHAKDAYLAGVIGDFSTSLLSVKDKIVFEKIKEGLEKQTQNPQKIKELVNKRNGYILNALEYDDSNTNELIDFETGEVLPNRFNNIKKTMSKNDCIVTKRIEEVANGKFYKETRYGRSGSKSNLIPLRYIRDVNGISIPLDPKLYGGYSNENPANCIIIKLTKKNNSVEYKMINVSVLDYLIQKNNSEHLNNIIKEKYGAKYSNVEIVNNCVPKNQLATLNGQWVYIISDSEYNNAVQLVLDSKFDKLMYFISKYNFVGKNRDIDHIRNFELSREYIKMQHDESSIDQLIIHYVDKINRLMPIYKVDITLDQIKTKLSQFNWDEKCNFVKELMKVSKCDGSRTDALKPLVGKSSYGRISGKSLDVSDAIFKYNSITGLYSNELKMI